MSRLGQPEVRVRVSSGVVEGDMYVIAEAMTVKSDRYFPCIENL